MARSGPAARSLVVWLAILVLATAAFGFELADILSSPFPSALTASPSGERVAWVFNREGRRSVWVARAPEWRGIEVHSMAPAGAAEDDGQEIVGLVWSDDGQRLAFVHGGAANSVGEFPNPLSVATGVKRSVWLLEPDRGRSRRIDDGSGPLFVPGGSKLLYLKEGAIWSTDVAGDAEPSKLVEARGGFAQLTPSPDGSRLAFSSRRTTHSFIGVYSFADGTIAWVDPGFDRDTAPSWSPDGGRIAFLRQPPRFDPILFEPLRSSAIPWSIRVAERGADGVWNGREAWRAEPGRGSVYRDVVARRQLYWMDDAELLFPWERNGWTNLWRLNLATGAATSVAAGEYEVELASQARPGVGVLFSSNAGDIDRRHTWRLDPGDATPIRLSWGDRIEQAPVALVGGDFAYLSAGGREPLHPEVSVGGRSRDLASEARSARFPLAEMVAPRAVRFRGTDGMEIHGQLFVPPGAEAGTQTSERPAVVFFHGGSRRQMLLGWHYSRYYHHCYAMHQYLVSQGYVVLSVNYRSGIGYGLDFREALDYGATGASELRDVLGAGMFLAGLDLVDEERIGLWGGSYGGYLTALGLSRASDLFAAGVDIHGVHDWNRTIQNFVPSYNPLHNPEVAQLAFRSSPMSSVDSWRSPVLLVHGDDDRNVPFAESVELSAELRARGVEVETLVFPDEVHGFLTHGHWLEVFRSAADFFDRHLRAYAGDHP